MYLAKDLPTNIAEAIVRNRFEGKIDRILTRGEVAGWGVCEVSAEVYDRAVSLALIAGLVIEMASLAALVSALRALKIKLI